MLNTTQILLSESIRQLRRKMKTSPILYFFFSLMIFFSILMFAALGMFLVATETEFQFLDLFYSVFFLLLMKSAHDLYTLYIQAPPVSYALSTDVPHTRTVGEIILSVVVINLALWFFFSLLYLLVLSFFGVDVNYPVEYLLFSVNVLIAVLLGCVLCLHFFSSKKYRLIPTALLLVFFWFSQSLLFIALLLPVVLLHSAWGLSHCLNSYRYVKRKQRAKDNTQVYFSRPLFSLFFREITVIWRQRLFLSFVSMSIITALGTGYLSVYGAELFIPESLRSMVGGFLPTLFVFLGCYIVVMYAVVFPALNLFLSEEKTVWILRNMPVGNDTIIYGKTLSLSLCFISTLPYLAYVSFFVGADNLLFLLWFLGFSCLAAVIIAIPLGVKYVGKKSDVLLLYSVSMILLIIVSIVGAGVYFLRHQNTMFLVLLCLLILLLELSILFLSLRLSMRIFSIRSKALEI